MGTTYTVYCRYHPEVDVYIGQDESRYNYYSNLPADETCYKCIHNRNEREKFLAKQRAEEKRRKEAERLKKIQQQKIENERSIRKEQREKQQQERVAAAAKLQEKVAQEIETIKQDIKRQQEEFDRKKAENERDKKKKEKKRKEQEKKQEEKRKEKEKKQFVKIVKDIAQRVTECSACGQAVIDTVIDIERDLKESLKAEYDNTVKPEIERYKKYGKEMRDMNKVFFNEFSSVLENDFKKRMKTINDPFDDEKEEDEQTIFDLNAMLNSGLSQAEAMNKFATLFAEKKKKKKKFYQDVGDKLNSLTKAINNMDAKLFQMEQYYDAVIEDHNKFIDFCKSEGAKYNNQFKEVAKYIQGEVGSKIKGKKRDLYEGQADDEKKEFTEEYEKYRFHAKQEADINNDNAGKGAAVGAVLGTAVGFVRAGPIGIIPGAIFGAILGVFAGCTLSYEYTTWITKSQKTVTVESKDYYDGNKQYEALQQIIDALENPIKKYVKELETSETNAEQQKYDAEQFFKTIKQTKNKISKFKEKAKEIMKEVKEADTNEELREKINQECVDLYAHVKALTNQLKPHGNK